MFFIQQKSKWDQLKEVDVLLCFYFLHYYRRDVVHGDGEEHHRSDTRHRDTLPTLNLLSELSLYFPKRDISLTRLDMIRIFFLHLFQIFNTFISN